MSGNTALFIAGITPPNRLHQRIHINDPYPLIEALNIQRNQFKSVFHYNSQRI